MHTTYENLTSLLDEMNEKAKKDKLEFFEAIAEIHQIKIEFTLENIEDYYIIFNDEQGEKFKGFEKEWIQFSKFVPKNEVILFRKSILTYGGIV